MTTIENRMLKVQTVAELLEKGWVGPKPHYDAAIVCPNCDNVLEKKTINAEKNESRAEGCQRVLLSDTGGFEMECSDCGAALFRNTTPVYDYRNSKEECRDPVFPYTINDLPIDIENYDPGVFAAAVLMRYFHTQADFATEAKHVPWGLDEHLHNQCPLCSAKDVELDFHHWEYNEDIGVGLCRGCHQTIHEGMRASEQSSWSQTGEWEDRALAELVRCHKLYRGMPGSDASIWEIKTRYNVPFPIERIKSAYQRRYGDCDHEYVCPPHCEHCGEIVWERATQ